MFKRIEAFFRRIIKEELTPIRQDAQAAFTDMEVDIKRIGDHYNISFEGFEKRFESEIAALDTRITERLNVLVTDMEARFNTLAADLEKRFEARAASIEQKMVAEHDHWKSDEETRKADHELRHPRPLKR